MYFKVHGIDLEDKEDENYDHVEDAKNEEGNGADPNDNGEQSNNQGTKKKKHRGKTTCSKIHNTEFSDRREVEFFQGQPIGPTTEVVSDLSYFLGTVAKNPSFVTLLYTSWHGVPSKNKEDMWVYANKKFILPKGSEEWVMEKLCDA
ncbi:hypothetical protein PIB30_056088 [Stylosanthes scabra]|uniref:Uncharacterized protein n=1 Tax=Stylosanthes scabra TaxID=79078 RepID=A0ABU6ULA8_9FABA|nr:hypothetical protein [Stylosanthes scabra]